jgi:hypothetical protein
MVLPNKEENPSTWELTSTIVKRSPMMMTMKSLNPQVANLRLLAEPTEANLQALEVSLKILRDRRSITSRLTWQSM